MKNEETLNAYLNAVGVNLNGECIKKLLAYMERVLQTNRLFNLTAITDEDAFMIKHIADSLTSISEIPKGAELLDIGAGAGFPSVPIAIARPDVRVTALDSTAKKMRFVEESANFIGLDNLKTIAGRAEEQKKLMGSFDVITARAVSSLSVLTELAMPLLKVGGSFLAYKTDEAELDSAEGALKALNAAHIRTKFATLPNGDGRAILVIKKLAPTPPQYPRKYGAIVKKPL